MYIEESVFDNDRDDKNVLIPFNNRLLEYYCSTVEPRLSDLIGTAHSSDTRKFGYGKLFRKTFFFFFNTQLYIGTIRYYYVLYIYYYFNKCISITLCTFRNILTQ